MIQIKFSQKINGEYRVYDTFDSWIQDSLANCDPYFQLIILAESDTERSVWPIWLDYHYIDEFPKEFIFDFLAHIVKTEKGIDLARA
jgi:hypothetical protein